MKLLLPTLLPGRFPLAPQRGAGSSSATLPPGLPSPFSIPPGHVPGGTAPPAACWDLAPGHETSNGSHAQRWGREGRGRKTHWSFPEVLGPAFPRQTASTAEPALTAPGSHRFWTMCWVSRCFGAAWAQHLPAQLCWGSVTNCPQVCGARCRTASAADIRSTGCWSC